MRLLAVLLLLATALPVTAQHVRVIDLKHDGILTWSNSHAEAYCRVEMKWNLAHTWSALGDYYPWNAYVTQPVSTFPLDLASSWRNLVSLPQGVVPDIQGLFFRVVSSEVPLAPRIATNLPS